MRRIITALTAVLIAVLPMMTPHITANCARAVGDADGDGDITPADASFVLSYYAELATGIDEYWDDADMNCGDIDLDQTITPRDASSVLQYYSYLSTLPNGEEIVEIREYLGFSSNGNLNPPDIGEPGTIRYIINTAKLTPRDSYPLYNIKGDNKYGGTPYKVTSYTVSENDKKIMDKFAAEHFTDNMTNYDKLEYTWKWLHSNVTYADGSQGWNTYSEIVSDSFAKACFEKKLGQCIQYNGALAEMLAYMGYDVYLLEMWNSNNFTNQHFRAEIAVDGVHYSIEVGNTKDGDYWMWLFDESEALYHGETDE